MCKPCGCFGSFFKMFQAQFQISLLSAHCYRSSKSTDGNSAMNLLKGYLHSINVLLAITTAIFLRESKLMPFHLLHRICLREALGRKDGAGGVLYRSGSRLYCRDRCAKSRRYFLSAKNPIVPVLENRCSHGQ